MWTGSPSPIGTETVTQDTVGPVHSPSTLDDAENEQEGAPSVRTGSPSDQTHRI